MPRGCPSAIAPPFGLTCAASSSTPSSRSTASPCAANASFNSITSICSISSPALANTFFAAGTGPMPISRGSTPAQAQVTILAIGLRSCLFTVSSDATSSAQAPSLIPAALPAVTEPSARTIGLSLTRPSIVDPSRGCSSVSTTIGSPRRCGTDTETISSASLPFDIASAALSWLRSAN